MAMFLNSCMKTSSRAEKVTNPKNSPDPRDSSWAAKGVILGRVGSSARKSVARKKGDEMVKQVHVEGFTRAPCRTRASWNAWV